MYKNVYFTCFGSNKLEATLMSNKRIRTLYRCYYKSTGAILIYLDKSNTRRAYKASRGTIHILRPL